MKPIDRLKGDFLKYKNSNMADKKNLNRMYHAVRAFALDCGLVTFNEVELMEYENK